MFDSDTKHLGMGGQEKLKDTDPDAEEMANHDPLAERLEKLACVMEMADAEEIASAARAFLTERVTREVIAGLLSTLDFRPAEHHPSECLPMADAVRALLRRELGGVT